MIWADAEIKYGWEGDTRTIALDMYADDVPSTFPTTTDDVERIEDGVKIVSPSTIYVINTAELYMMNSRGEWKLQ